MNNLQLMTIFALVAVLAISVPLQSVYAESGFTNTKKTAGVIMKFCANEVFTLGGLMAISLMLSLQMESNI